MIPINNENIQQWRKCTLWLKKRNVFNKGIKANLKLTNHSCQISEKVCPFYCHHHIKRVIRCIFGENSTSSSSSSLSNVIFENASNNVNNEANSDTSELYLSSKIQINKI